MDNPILNNNQARFIYYLLIILILIVVNLIVSAIQSSVLKKSIIKELREDSQKQLVRNCQEKLIRCSNNLDAFATSVHSPIQTAQDLLNTYYSLESSLKQLDRYIKINEDVLPKPLRIFGDLSQNIEGLREATKAAFDSGKLNTKTATPIAEYHGKLVDIVGKGLVACSSLLM